MPPLNKPIGVWLFYAHHQMLFFSKLCQIAKQQDFSEENLKLIHISVMTSCIKNSLNLIRWIKQEMQTQGRFLEAAKVQKIWETYQMDKKTDIVSYKKFIEYANQEADDDESKAFASKIINILDTEINWYDSNKIDYQYTKNIIEPRLSLPHTIKEVVRNHPLLKKTLIGMLSVYLSIRFFPIYYPLIRDTREKNEKTN
jgi:hypothetical protein